MIRLATDPITRVVKNRGLYIHHLEGRLVISVFKSIELNIEKIWKYEQRKQAKNIVLVSEDVKTMRAFDFHLDAKNILNEFFFGVKAI